MVDERKAAPWWTLFGVTMALSLTIVAATFEDGYLTKTDNETAGATVATTIAEKGKDVFVRKLDAAPSATSAWLV